MCYPKPGPRCSAHVKKSMQSTAKKITQLREKMEAETDPEKQLSLLREVGDAEAKLLREKEAYEYTPEGAQELYNKIVEVYTPLSSPEEAHALASEEKNKRLATRKKLIEDYKDSVAQEKDSLSPREKLEAALKDENIPGETLRRMHGLDNFRLNEKVLNHPNLPKDILDEYAYSTDDEDSWELVAANPNLPHDVVPDYIEARQSVQAELARNPNLKEEHYHQLLETNDKGVEHTLALNPSTPGSVVQHLLNGKFRKLALDHPNLPERFQGLKE